ncbi:hypothetical protein LVD17_15525 [Fulvivirga ulvae]|uniref:hypothetical protein n=1 Tax=Fulvivirga ulvae TaxID=2904245 RepID=UPI001F346976|nr:hypothetical protein [Fulvivirga ulvae]UII29709.1 hypothetical protein LVD17_15525 [Fulvivirga ulvae]
MKFDKFTKVILTVIAVNLSILTLKELSIIPEAHADDLKEPVQLVENQKYGLVPVNADGSITVRLSDKVDVNLIDINTSDKLNIHLKSSDSYSLKNAGPLEVRTD